MQFFEYIGSAWTIIRRNKMRSFLTMLGIIIGVMSVVVILSVGAGAQSLVLNQIKSLGSNLIGVIPGKSQDNGPPAAVFGIVVTTLTSADAQAIADTIPHVAAASGYVRGAATVTGGETQTDTTYVGVAASYPAIETFRLAEGRFFTDDEDRSLSRVAVLGSTVAKNLFGGESALGQKIKIKRVSFTVIGTIKERGVSGFQNQDDQVFVPLQTGQKLLLGINYVNFIRVKVDDASQVNGVVDQLVALLRERHHINNPDNDDFTVRSTNQGIDVITSVTNALKFFLAAIVALSLVVGGIGIMNIMLAAVEERTQEIGLRKAVGATERDIIVQFLIETISITLVGGLIGIIAGVGVSVAIAAVARSLGYQWDLVISPDSIIVACGISISVGLIFGLSPARRASRLNPIEALRYE